MLILTEVLKCLACFFMIHVIYLKAEILAKQAVGVAKTVYGESHLKYADSLIDYG